ncbi:MAG TPA: universal stress protein [Candidatus Binataceae bacterium]|nr:universal stress protein [Candidatus Binataceae bacterium]
MEKFVPFPAHLKNILCPIDFDSNSVAALDVAAKLARRDAATVWMMHVTPHGGTGEPGGTIPTPDWDSQAKMEKIARERIGDHVTCETLCRTGDPGHEIVSAAEEIGADMVVMATHGYTGALRTLIGSVCDRVMQDLRCPLLVVRPQAENRTAPEHPAPRATSSFRVSRANPLFFWEDT